MPAADRAIFQVVHTLGELMRFWGFRDVLGRIWGLLYLSAEPVTPEEISRRLQISRGNVSLALQEMQRWGAVRRIRVPGQAASVYAVEMDLWKPLARVYRERERHEAERAQHAFAEALAALESSGMSGHDGKAFLISRIRRLERLAALAGQVLDQLAHPSVAKNAAALLLLGRLRKTLSAPD